MKIITLIIFCSLFVGNKVIAQVDTLKLRASMIVHSDIEFPVYNTTNIIDIYKDYDVVELNTDGIYHCKIYKIIYKWSITDTLYGSCIFYIAYSDDYNRFFKLTGFKQSEFIYFYNRVLLGGAVIFPKNLNSEKKRLKYIRNNIKIEGLDIYSTYKNFSKMGCYDINSCYNKYNITEYKK